eukprot:TRINITY_DN14825_c0_g1_i1.p1 TRINITY_DN14825_c0_g1~~TRINITY_DN14825_c0_g1_i1.p1  ORF type:complete len:396 (+),score=29.43 TRINITY_DN14825_c0_g1_i1:150-1190(+)
MGTRLGGLSIFGPEAQRRGIAGRATGAWRLWGIRSPGPLLLRGARGLHISRALLNKPPAGPPPPEGRPPAKNPVYYRETIRDKLRAAIAAVKRAIVRAVRYPYLHYTYLFRRTRILLAVLFALLVSAIAFALVPEFDETLPQGPVTADRSGLQPNNTDLLVLDGVNILIDDQLIKLLYLSPLLGEHFGQEYRVDRNSVTLRYLPRPLGFEGMPSSIQALSVSFMMYGTEAIGQVEVSIDLKVVPQYGSRAMYDVICKILSVAVIINAEPMIHLDLQKLLGENDLNTYFRPLLYCVEKADLRLEEDKSVPRPIRSEMDLPDTMFQAPAPIYVPPVEAGLEPPSGGDY